MYVMPFSKTRIFLEETSLVARPAIQFDELKERLKVRMAHLGIKVRPLQISTNVEFAMRGHFRSLQVFCALARDSCRELTQVPCLELITSDSVCGAVL